jgi:hypothetical protein
MAESDKAIHSAQLGAAVQTETFLGMVSTRQMHKLSEPVVHRKDQLTRSLEITRLAAAKVVLDETDINSGHHNSPFQSGQLASAAVTWVPSRESRRTQVIKACESARVLSPRKL